MSQSINCQVRLEGKYSLLMQSDRLTQKVFSVNSFKKTPESSRQVKRDEKHGRERQVKRATEDKRGETEREREKRGREEMKNT